MSTTQHISTDNQSVQDLAGLVTTLPHTIYLAQIEVIDAYEALKRAKLVVKKNDEAQFLLAEAKTVREKDAIVFGINFDQHNELITKEIVLMKKEARFEELKNDFAAARKKMGQQEAMINSKL